MINALRQTHALEHATVTILSQRYPGVPVAGRSTPGAFIIYGALPTEAVRQAAEEGLARLQAGEHELAIHPRCGTNLAVAGTLGLLVPLAGLGARSRAVRWASLLLGLGAAIVASQPLGRLAQQHVTTSPDLAGVRLADVQRQEFAGFISHKVTLSRE
jgi:hypothetical protein